jgi:hypothetical protein
LQLMLQQFSIVMVTISFWRTMMVSKSEKTADPFEPRLVIGVSHRVAVCFHPCHNI